MPNINTLILKSDYDTKIAEIENKYVSNTEFDSKLAQVNVATSTNFDAKVIEIENIKNYKDLIWAILEVKVILKKMVHKIIYYFNQYRNILKILPILIIFHHGNLKDYLMKVLNHLKRLIIVLLQH